MEGAAETQPAPPDGASSQTRATASPAAATQGNLVDEAARVATTLNDKLPTLPQETRLRGNHGSAAEEAREPRARDGHDGDSSAALGARRNEEADASPPPPGREPRATESAESADGRATAAPPMGQTDARGRMRQRAVSVGASVGENLRPRVEKLREASTVVFDEASDDPGLRFVLIAALLFLLFLFILLFSYILG